MGDVSCGEKNAFECWKQENRIPQSGKGQKLGRPFITTIIVMVMVMVMVIMASIMIMMTVIMTMTMTVMMIGKEIHEIIKWD